MTENTMTIQQHESFTLAAADQHQRTHQQWKRRVKLRAEKIKKQLQLENRFHLAMKEMHTTCNPYRLSYLHWILNHMFTTFDYETGLQAINNKDAYQQWLSANTAR